MPKEITQRSESALKADVLKPYILVVLYFVLLSNVMQESYIGHTCEKSFSCVHYTKCV
jgi:hypothetical protein